MRSCARSWASWINGRSPDCQSLVSKGALPVSIADDCSQYSSPSSEISRTVRCAPRRASTSCGILGDPGDSAILIQGIRWTRSSIASSHCICSASAHSSQPLVPTAAPPSAACACTTRFAQLRPTSSRHCKAIAQFAGVSLSTVSTCAAIFCNVCANGVEASAAAVSRRTPITSASPSKVRGFRRSASASAIRPGLRVKRCAARLPLSTEDMYRGAIGASVSVSYQL